MPGAEPESFECFACHHEVEGDPAGILHGNSNHPFCHDCNDERVVSCVSCDDYIEEYTANFVSNDVICESCVESYYSMCDYCEELVNNEDTSSPGGSDVILCEACYDDCPSCTGCDCVVTETIELDGDDLCDYCARERGTSLLSDFVSCYLDGDGDDIEVTEDSEELLSRLITISLSLNLFDCERREWECIECASLLSGQLPSCSDIDLVIWLVEGRTVGMCRLCSGELTPNPDRQHKYKVMSYSHKPRPEFKRTMRDVRNRALHFGTEVELEMFELLDDRNVALAQLAERDKKHKLFYCKHDSCIKNGFELVSHPFTFDWMEQNRDAFDTMFSLSKLMKGFESTGCGMHIHMSADAFTNLHLFKFMRWFYSNRDYIKALSRRPRRKLETWANMARPEEKAMLSYALDKKKSMHLGRAALNLDSSKTIECRIFRSTLSPTSYYGNIEFLQSLFDYTKNSGIKEVGYEPYMKFVKERGQSYKNFLNLNEIICPSYEEMEGE